MSWERSRRVSHKYGCKAWVTVGLLATLEITSMKKFCWLRHAVVSVGGSTEGRAQKQWTLLQSDGLSSLRNSIHTGPFG